jgi:hypothetical protein
VRGLAHLTASLTVNRPGLPDTLVYLARATVFNGEHASQGFGVDARKYSGQMSMHRKERRLKLTYDGAAETAFPIIRESYDVRQSILPGDIFV